MQFDESNSARLASSSKEGGILKQGEYISSKQMKKEQAYKTSFLFGGGGVWSNEGYPESEDKQVQQEKKSCWTCYKLIEDGILARGKWFCDGKCQSQQEEEEAVRVG